MKTREERRAYNRVYHLRRYRKFMKRVHAILGAQCSCGARRDLQVDHRDPSKKRFTVSKAWGRPWPDVLRELKKCQILCRSCHKKKTSKEQIGPHGTWGRYRNGRCRCQVCRSFVSAYVAKWRKTYRPKVIRHGTTVWHARMCQTRCSRCLKVLRVYARKAYWRRRGVVV